MVDVFQNWPLGHSIVWQGSNDNVGGNIPLLNDLVDSKWNPDDRAAIVRYLANAPVHCAVIGNHRATCALCGLVDYNPSLKRSDGLWSWPDSLSHLVDAHAVRIPNDFVVHIQDHLDKDRRS